MLSVEVGHEREFVEDREAIVINLRGGASPDSPEMLGGLINAARDADTKVFAVKRLQRYTEPEMRDAAFAADRAA